MSENDHINMRGNYPEPEKEMENMSRENDGVLSQIDNEETSMMIFSEPDSDIIFVSIDDVTIHMTESKFYSLVKTSQEAARKLLNLE